MNGYIYLPNLPTCPEVERLAEAFAQYRWAYAIRDNSGYIVEFGFCPNLGATPPRNPPILFDDCEVAVWLDPLDIRRIFAIVDHQQWAISLLYSVIHPEWDNIVRLNDYPRVNYATSDELFKAFIRFDQMYHPDVLSGGAWMNSGFGTCTRKDMLPDYVVLQCPHDQIVYR